MATKPTQRYIEELKHSLMKLNDQDKVTLKSEIEYIREWITLEFGARFMDLEFTEKDIEDARSSVWS